MFPVLKQYPLELEKTQFVLLPSKLMWWPEEHTLFMADSHFGKASTFRRAGLAVPLGTTSKMLLELSNQVELFKARTLIVLGDLLHSNVSSEHDFEGELLAWRQKNDTLKCLLVKGNHDRKPHRFYERFGIEVFKTATVPWGPFELCHDPAAVSGDKLALCGHIHPAIHLAGGKLKCFWLREHQLILPAFGEFTGTARIDLGTNETAFAICEGSLIKISASSR